MGHNDYECIVCGVHKDNGWGDLMVRCIMKELNI